MTLKGRILALDVGDKRIGVAVSDPLQITARAYSVIERSDRSDVDVEAISRLARDLDAESIVLGLPLNNAGEKAYQAERVIRFAEELRKGIAIPIVFEDERYTTAIAQRGLRADNSSRKRGKTSLDALAAQQILASYLSRLRMSSAVKQENENT